MPKLPDFPLKANMSRRSMLAAGAAGVGVVGLAGAGWVLTQDPKDLILALLKHALPGITIDEPTARVFAVDYMDEFYGQYQAAGLDPEKLISAAKMHAAESVRDVVGVERFVAMGPFEERSYDLTRRAVTRFLMNSNFFYLEDPTSEPIVYFFRPLGTPCTNPFAHLSPPAAEDVVPVPTPLQT